MCAYMTRRQMIPLPYNSPHAATSDVPVELPAVREFVVSHSKVGMGARTNNIVVALLDQDHKTSEAINDALHLGGYEMLGFSSAGDLLSHPDLNISCCIILD